MVLTMVMDKNIPRLRHLCNPVMYRLAGVHQSQEEFNSRPVSSEARSLETSDTMWDMHLVCTTADSKCEYEGSSLPDRNGRITSAAHPVITRIVSLSMT